MTARDFVNERVSSPSSQGAGSWQPRERRVWRRYWTLALAVTFSCVAGAASTRTGAQAKTPPDQAFTPRFVLETARRAAAAPFLPRRLEGPPALQQLTYDQYRDIRFNADQSIWRNEQVPFRLELLPAGFLFKSPVKISIVENRIAREATGAPAMFSLGPLVAKQLANQTLPLSGFRARTRLNSRSVWDEFLVFQGASYFRAIDRGGAYGLSARGLALRTAQPIGEEFPAFTHFWIERPGANAAGLVVHALLDSESTAGAYRFAITPGAETTMEVDVTLFPRVDLDHVGIAPLTSMFLFDESERTRIDDFRDEVHDSDGVGRTRLASVAQSAAAPGFELYVRRAQSVRSDSALAPRIRLSRLRGALRRSSQRLDRADEPVGRRLRGADRDSGRQ
jgi:periplasmic glucans biosynthesis protein